MCWVSFLDDVKACIEKSLQTLRLHTKRMIFVFKMEELEEFLLFEGMNGIDKGFDKYVDDETKQYNDGMDSEEGSNKEEEQDSDGMGSDKDSDDGDDEDDRNYADNDDEEEQDSDSIGSNKDEDDQNYADSDDEQEQDSNGIGSDKDSDDEDDQNYADSGDEEEQDYDGIGCNNDGNNEDDRNCVRRVFYSKSDEENKEQRPKNCGSATFKKDPATSAESKSEAAGANLNSAVSVAETGTGATTQIWLQCWR